MRNLRTTTVTFVLCGFLSALAQPLQGTFDGFRSNLLRAPVNAEVTGTPEIGAVLPLIPNTRSAIRATFDPITYTYEFLRHYGIKGHLEDFNVGSTRWYGFERSSSFQGLSSPKESGSPIAKTSLVLRSTREAQALNNMQEQVDAVAEVLALFGYIPFNLPNAHMPIFCDSSEPLLDLWVSGGTQDSEFLIEYQRALVGNFQTYHKFIASNWSLDESLELDIIYDFLSGKRILDCVAEKFKRKKFEQNPLTVDLISHGEVNLPYNFPLLNNPGSALFSFHLSATHSCSDLFVTMQDIIGGMLTYWTKLKEYPLYDTWDRIILAEVGRQYQVLGIEAAHEKLIDALNLLRQNTSEAAIPCIYLSNVVPDIAKEYENYQIAFTSAVARGEAEESAAGYYAWLSPQRANVPGEDPSYFYLLQAVKRAMEAHESQLGALERAAETSSEAVVPFPFPNGAQTDIVRLVNDEERQVWAEKYLSAVFGVKRSDYETREKYLEEKERYKERYFEGAAADVTNIFKPILYYWGDPIWHPLGLADTPRLKVDTANVGATFNERVILQSLITPITAFAESAGFGLLEIIPETPCIYETPDSISICNLEERFGSTTLSANSFYEPYQRILERGQRSLDAMSSMIINTQRSEYTVLSNLSNQLNRVMDLLTTMRTAFEDINRVTSNGDDPRIESILDEIEKALLGGVIRRAQYSLNQISQLDASSDPVRSSRLSDYLALSNEIAAITDALVDFRSNLFQLGVENGEAINDIHRSYNNGLMLAPTLGIVQQLQVKAGDSVLSGSPLLSYEALGKVEIRLEQESGLTFPAEQTVLATMTVDGVGLCEALSKSLVNIHEGAEVLLRHMETQCMGRVQPLSNTSSETLMQFEFTQVLNGYVSVIYISNWLKAVDSGTDTRFWRGYVSSRLNSDLLSDQQAFAETTRNLFETSDIISINLIGDEY